MKLIRLVKSRPFAGLLAHAVLLQLALSLAYNTYKEYERGFAPLTGPMKSAIKGTFPWAVLLFSVLYIIFSRGKKDERIFLSPVRYLAALCLYALVMNSVFSSGGLNVIIPVNMALIYFVLLLAIIRTVGGLVLIDLKVKFPGLNLQDWTPPIIYRFLTRERDSTFEFLKKSPARFLIKGFSVLLLLCVLLFGSGKEGAAETIADIAFFCLLAGLSIKLYLIIRYGSRDEL